MKLRVRRFNPWSLAKLLAKLYFFLGCLLTLVCVPIALFTTHKEGESPVVTAIIFAGMFLVFYPIMGLVTGLIGAYLYNFISGKSGGIEVEVDNIDAEPKSGQ